MRHNKTAELYRIVMDSHVCPYGIKAKYLLRHKGYHVDDKWLTSRKEVDNFKKKHDVKTTPQIFIDNKRVGGWDELRRYFGIAVQDPSATTYRPVVALFIMMLLMSLAVNFSFNGNPFTVKALELFIAFSMAILALLKLQDVESFSSMFLNYDLLARRWVPYSYLYPFAEGLAGILMISGVFYWLSVPLAFTIGAIGAISVFKAVYIDKRELKCACVGGASNVPLGFISLTENIMMMIMAIWMASVHLIS
ncbi:MAG: glutaredoxin [Vibrionaceae bacterium]|nr:glutaredoxin [Vibrionaceae bacterium]